MNLLLAVDDSHFSEVAANEVAARPWPSGTVVRVLSVAPAMLGTPVAGIPVAGALEPTGGLTGAFEARTELLETSNRLVQRVADRLRAAELQVDTMVREGDAGSGIIAEAESWPADLIVVGSHGHTGLKRLLLGSVAHYVTNHAPCSVEVVRLRRTQH
ncbi:MAG TPA: universal stress protein [Polyangiales bacterium]|nr:universal stress protein [Polyangiales bacterium]